MANQIRLKRASGSDPSASDLVTGELAVRTDTAKLFTKKDDNSVAEIGASVGTDSVDSNAIQDDAVTADKLASDAVVTASIVNDAVTFAKQQNISTSRVLGRVTSSTGNVEELTAANIRTLINVEDGATADQTASEILTALLTVDGTGSGIVATSAGGVDVSAVSTNSDLRILFTTNNDGSGKTIGCSSGSDDFTYNPNSQALVVGGVIRADGGFNVDGTTVIDGSGDIVAAQVPTLNQNTTGSSASCTGNAATATKLAATKTIAGVAFDGSANISLNNDAITNGAGYITATLTEEQVEDFVGGMVTGNTETGITVTYQDSDGTLDFVVATQSDNNFTTTLLNKLNGIATGATNVTNNNQISNGAGYLTSADGGNAATLDGIDSSQFLRSDTADSASGVLSLSAGLSFGSDSRCAAGISSLSDGSTITVNFTSGIHHSVTLGGNRTFGNPSNDGSAVGQSGSIFITQDGTGSRTASFHSDYKFAGGTAPTLSTAANAVDRLDYVIKASGVIHCVVTLDVK